MTFRVTRKMTTTMLSMTMPKTGPGHKELIKRVTKRANEMKFETGEAAAVWIFWRAQLLNVNESCTDQEYDLAQRLLIDSIDHYVEEDGPMDKDQRACNAIATAKATLNL